MIINGSIVLYKNNPVVLKKAIFSFLKCNLDVYLILIDNSPTDKLRYLSNLDPRIEYIHNRENIGFGKAHNIALRKSISDGAKYHLILNPDIYFSENVICELYEFMEKNTQSANVMPKVCYENGEIQYLCKLFPSPLELFVRRFIYIEKFIRLVNKKYELRNFSYNEILNVPFLSGCFMFLRVEHLRSVGLFDERFFMYMEDLDLNRRLHSKYSTLFYPYVKITHTHAKGSFKNKLLLYYHVKSAIYYFNKWGWFFDKFRRLQNKRVILAAEKK